MARMAVNLMKNRRKMSTMKNMVCFGLLLVTLFLFAGCNTMKGAGRDIERGGEKIQEVAD
jgi:entericidin B